jgi:hypothetical protein
VQARRGLRTGRRASTLTCSQFRCLSQPVIAPGEEGAA